MQLDSTFRTSAGPRIRMVDAETFEALKQEGYLRNRNFVLQTITDGGVPICSFYIIDVDETAVIAANTPKVQPQPVAVAHKPMAARSDGWECLGSVPVYFYFYNDAYPIGEQEDYTLYEKNGMYQIRNGQGKTFYVSEARGHRSSFQYSFFDGGSERYFNV